MKQKKNRFNLYQKTIVSMTFSIILLMLLLWASKFQFENNYSNLNIMSNSENRFEVKDISNASLREYFLTAEKVKHTIVENKSTEMYLYNSKLPGEIIRAKVGDTLRIHLENKLSENTTIHWHGMQVENSMDGIPGITQDAIEPSEKYIYEFKVRNPGIYWYHPHFNTAHQIEMGLYGALIVDDKEDIIEADKDVVLMLDDIRLDEKYQISEGMYGHDIMHGRSGNVFLINGNPSFNFEAKKGDILRLRLINPSNARIYNFEIENHKMLVIGHDIGLLEKSYETDMITISPGERYDILVYIKELGDIKYYTKYFTGKYELGSIKVTKVNEHDKKGYYQSLRSQTLNSKIPDWSNLSERESDFRLELFPARMDDGNFQWVINEKSSNYDSEKITLEEGKLYKITLKNLHGQPHPMHMHGQKFLILSRDDVPVKKKGYKDTVLVNGGETVEIAFVAEGKGTWLNHCHILEHAEVGMSMEINVS